MAVLGMVVYAGALWSGAQGWTQSPDEQHGFLVFPIALLLLYLRRASFPWGTTQVDLRGLVLIALAAGMRIYGELYMRPWLDLWSLPLWIGGVVWLFSGWKVFRWAAPAIAFLVFMAPLPGQIQTAAGFPLQRIAATGGGGLLQMFGQPAFVSGTTILLGDNVLDVERACSGLRMFHGMLAVAVAWSLLSGYRWPRFLAMLVIAPLIAIFVNILRITVTGFLFQYVSGDAARAFSHDWAGLLMIPAGLVIFLLIDLLGERLQKLNRGQADRWAMTAAAAAVVFLMLGGAAYGIFQRQQRGAVGYVLEQARELAAADDPEQQARAMDFYRRYLSVREDDAEVLSELATLNVKLGRSNWSRAGRLYEMAWQQDSSRTFDAIASLTLLAGTNDWQRLWERSDKLAPRLSGDERRAVLRLRTHAIGRLTAGSGIAADLDRMFAACRQGIADDGNHFNHAWQLAQLARLHPNRARQEDIRSGAETEQPVTQYPATELPMTPADALAVAIIDRAIAEYPHEAQPWIYRATLLQSALGNLRAGNDTESLHQALAESAAEALQIVGKQFPLEGELPPLPQPATASVAATEVSLSAEMSESGEEDELPALDDDATERKHRLTAATAYLLSGYVAVRDGDRERAEALIQRSRELSPRNPQAYLQLLGLLPASAIDERIELLESAIENCGSGNLALLFPLVESYFAVGRDDDAVALLEPLEEVLPNFTPVARGRLQLMRGQARAGGLARQNRIRESAELLAATLADPDVHTHRNSYASRYAQANFQLGALYQSIDQDAAALAAFQEGGLYAPESAVWLVSAAQSYEAAGDLKSALQSYQKAASASGQQRPAVYLSIARVLLAQQRQASAEERDMEQVRSMIRAAIDRGADVVQATSILAETYVAQDDLSAALNVIEQQLKETPETPTLIFSGALIRQLAGDVDAAIAELPRYEAAGGTPDQKLLLHVLLLQRAGRQDEAAAVVEAAANEFDDEQIRQPRTQVVLGKFREGQADEAVTELEQLVADYPDSLDVQRVAANVFNELQRDDVSQQIEANLRRIEGERGTLWRAARATRLLRGEADETQREETEQLVRQLESLLPNAGQTRSLRGRLAQLSGDWQAALTAYEDAWSAGYRDAELATRLLAALNRTGQTRRASEYLQQLETLIPRSTSLFDLAMPQFVLGDRGQDALKLAREWVESDPSPENLIRLGQTLMTIAGSGRSADVFPEEQALGMAVDQAEQAFTSAIRDDPSNLDAWVGAFRVHVGLQQDRKRALENLKQLSQQLDIDPFRRSFVLAQLYTAIGEDARAGRQFEDALVAAEEQEPEIRQAVRLVAARFLAERRPERAMEICRQELAEFPQSDVAKTYLLGMLADQGSASDLDEAIQLQASLGSADQPNQKRLRARLLMERAVRNERAERASESDAGTSGTAASTGKTPAVKPEADRDQAIALLQSITPSEASDAFVLAGLYAAQGRTLDAFSAFRESFRLQTPSVQGLAAFLEFWNENYAAEGTYVQVADEYTRQLKAMPGGVVAWLRLRLLRAQTEVAAQENKRAETAGTEPVAGEETAAEEAELVRREGEILAEFRKAFIPEEGDEELAGAIIAMVSGLASAQRPAQIPAAIDALQLDHDSPAIVSALAVSLMRLTGNAAALEVIADQVRQRADPQSERLAEQQMLLGGSLYVAGMTERSAEHLRVAVAQESEDLGPKNDLAIVLAELGTDPTEALRLAEQVMEADPENIEGRDTKLVVSILLEDWDRAEQIAATLTDEFTPTILLHRAYLAHQQGRDDESEELFRRARDARVGNSLVAPYDRRFYQTLSETQS